VGIRAHASKAGGGNRRRRREGGTENLVRKAIVEGTDPQEAYVRHGKF
jgi:hypothetical protein